MGSGGTDNWLRETLDCSTVLRDYYLTMPPDDSFGWGSTLGKMWFPTPSVRPTGTGVLLTGPDGSGKHTAAAHLIRSFLKNDYDFVLLRGEDLEPEDGVKALKDRLNALLDHFLNQNKGLCLVLDGMMRSQAAWEIGQFLGEMLCFYFVRRNEDFLYGGPKDGLATHVITDSEEQFSPLFLILIEKKEEGLPSILRSRLQMCRMSYPNEQQRMNFLRSHEALFLPELISVDEFLQQTEGLSYAQLEDLINSLNSLDGMDGQTLRAVLASQLPEKKERTRLLERLGELAQKIPELLQRSAAAVQTADHVPYTSVEQKQTKTEARTDYDQESGTYLANRVFTQEELDKLTARVDA